MAVSSNCQLKQLCTSLAKHFRQHPQTPQTQSQAPTTGCGPNPSTSPSVSPGALPPPPPVQLVLYVLPPATRREPATEPDAHDIPSPAMDGSAPTAFVLGDSLERAVEKCGEVVLCLDERAELLCSPAISHLVRRPL